jgi:hypothetical protein
MTIERPMFPPRADERCQIIQFSAAARISPKRRKPIAMAAGTGRMSRVELDQEPEIPARDEAETITLRNRNLRDARKDAWRKAEVIREYWRARMGMESAIKGVQNHDLPEGNNHPRHDDPNERSRLVANWRQAVAQQTAHPTRTKKGG